MGMYTKFDLNVRLRWDIPDDVLRAIRHMVDNRPQENWPNHPLFQTERFLSMMSYTYSDNYKPPIFVPDGDTNTWLLCIACEFKNYDQEIQKFIDFIKPYIVHSEECEPKGYIHYEEWDEPKKIKFTHEGDN